MSEDNKEKESGWVKWFKNISFFAVAGALASFAVNFATEWYMERKSEEYERMTAMANQLEELNKNMAVMAQSQQDERNDREALWKVMQHTNADMNEIKVQVKINAHLNERNYKDIKSAHAVSSNNNHVCEMDHVDKKADAPKKLDVKKLTELQKIWKRSMGTDAEKKVLAEEEAKKAEEAKTQQLIEEAKKPDKHKTLDQFKEQHKLPNAPPPQQRQKR